ncbi:MAG TPA: CorA family divalent cation transporter [Pirellulales bacterium]|nr:CorA family divalent cation transporter [Pirellulales bacterium]
MLSRPIVATVVTPSEPANPAMPAAKNVLPAAWKVPDVFRARLGEAAGRQRTMESAGHLLLVLHEPPVSGETERRGRFFWRDADGVWKSNSLGAGVQALRKHVAEHADRVEALDDQLQQAQLSDDYFRVLHSLAPLYRASRHLHAALQQAREMAPADRDLITLRDQAGEIERAAELLQSDAKHGLDFLIARKTEEQAQRGYEMAVSAHRLNLLAAIFFPIATLSAIFGMNLEHGLPQRSTGVFWTVLVIGLVSGMFLTLLVASRPTSRSTSSASKPAKPRKPNLRKLP